jgi:nucleoside-diphosphate-sugar epimerase
MPVLVVGGGGYIGNHVVEKLIESGNKVRVFDKFYYGEKVKNDMEKISNVEVIEGDVSDLYSLTIALENVKSVVHLAGIVGDPASSIDKNLTRHINIVTTRMLKETVKAFRIPRFIFASSCSVYGASENIVDENASLNPVSLYAQTKIDSEKELLNDPYDYFQPTILRFATVFGHLIFSLHMLTTMESYLYSEESNIDHLSMFPI